MSEPALKLSREVARRFLVRALALAEPHAGVAAALSYHGYVQIDPINVCGRMHDLILRPRVAGYREGELLAYVHGEGRPGVEHFLPEANVLSAFPREAWRYLAARMRWRREQPDGRFPAKEERFASWILEEIRDRGPLTSAEIEHDARATTGWGTDGRMVKVMLERLFSRGRVLIAGRTPHFHRRYDLPERVVGPELAAQEPATAEELARWSIVTRLRQRRLVALKRGDLARVEDLVHVARIDDGPPLMCLRDDAVHFEENGGAPALPPVLLAPLDPILYDRGLARRIWDLHYTWEVYTPPEKRVRGYYALPVLAGGGIVGHVDPKADRAARKLKVMSRQISGRVAVSGAVKELAGFLGLRV